jgi:hypothetical protein
MSACLILLGVLLARVHDGRDLLDARHEDEDVAALALRILVVDQLQDSNVRRRVQLLRGALLDGRDWEELNVESKFNSKFRPVFVDKT